MTSRYNSERDKFLWHNSPEDYLAFLKQPNVRLCHPNAYGTDTREEWAGVPFDAALVKLENGDISCAEKAEKILSQMADQNVFSIGRPIISTGIVGFAPNVPAVIAGMPETMFFRDNLETENETAPITIYVETAISAGVTNDQITNRATAILALVLAMNMVRPVELYAMSNWSFDRGGNKCCGNIVKIASRPMDLARAAWMIMGREYTRRFSFAAARYLAFPEQHGRPAHHDTMPQAWNLGHCDQYEESIRDALSIQPHDIVIRGGYLFDEVMLNNPVQWVKNMIAKHNNQEAV